MRYLLDVEEVVSIVPPAEREMLTITNLYNVAQEYEVSVPEEEMARYKALFPQFRYLKVRVIVTSIPSKGERCKFLIAVLQCQHGHFTCIVHS